MRRGAADVLVRRLAGTASAHRRFEQFCALWLFRAGWVCDVRPIGGLTEVERAALLLPKRDVGIDLVGRTHSGGAVAVQCKFRSASDTPVRWREIATFHSLCMRTGPWESQVLFTTAERVVVPGRVCPQERFVTRRDLNATLTETAVHDMLDVAACM